MDQCESTLKGASDTRGASVGIERMSSNNNNNMEELSIDSRSSTKKVKQIKRPLAESFKKETCNKSHQQQLVQKPHFKIEWRELSYYHKQGSLVDQVLDKVKFGRRRLSSKQAGGQEAAPTDTKRILNSLDGCFRSGELSAILGPSGAGKSTFLNTLFGAKQEGAYGRTRVTWLDQNGEPVLGGRRSIKIASLPQHDHLLNHLTVYESLLFASKIKNADNVECRSGNKSWHKQNVRRVAKMLKLSECLDTRCGQLSGGQYKRVSIGQELLSEPDVIILDEPTSGLDAMTCLTTIQTLKSIVTRNPMCIILTIHQPDIDVFNIFDHVYVIAQGGLAIYEGSPRGITQALAEVQLATPDSNYNPARFIVEHAFLAEPPDLVEMKQQQQQHQQLAPPQQINVNPAGGCSSSSTLDNGKRDLSDEDDDDDDSDLDAENRSEGGAKEYLRRSLLSLTDIISGKEMISGSGTRLAPSGCRNDKRPLLNIGIQTLDGRLITSEQLARTKDEMQRTERLNLLKRLNQNQKARYRDQPLSPSGHRKLRHHSNGNQPPGNSAVEQSSSTSSRSSSSGKSDYSSHLSSGCLSMEKHTGAAVHKASSMAQLASGGGPPAMPLDEHMRLASGGRSLQMIDMVGERESMLSCDADTEFVSIGFIHDQLAARGKPEASRSQVSTAPAGSPPMGDDEDDDCAEDEEDNDDGAPTKLRRQFDKRLSAKHNCSKQRDQPIMYHAFVLTHRTWLSIVRDPIFFGIQACMHTIIPVVLALIFGSVQEEGCPRIGSFDLVEFAYSDSANMIQGTMSSIRKLIGNVGIVFFEMFVLSFSINCITALVFPLDMHVLLKEYRNGWYSLRSYLLGRTLADLPVPVMLHTLAMIILCYLTAQPLPLWRFAAIVALVILASLISQSIGLTIGALLMQSSQSAVLAAAGIVAPFFALSGFIVRIHTLPLVAQVAAKLSYLYYLLNGFIIMRYGFGRCHCSSDDFQLNRSHQIPSNLHTMASMWIGTYSDEYASSTAMADAVKANRSNVDPNIDVVDKMLQAFKVANSYGHEINDCNDVIPYAMLEFNLRDQDIYICFIALGITLVLARCMTFSAIYYKVRSYT